MNKTNVIRLLAPGVAVALGICAQATQSFRFYAKEAEHLWLNDPIWFKEQLSEPSGIAQLLASAVSQFYGLPCVGALVFALVCGCVCWALGNYCPSAQPMDTLAVRRRALAGGLGVMPCVFLLLSHESGFYNLKGDVAFMMAVVAAVAFCAVAKRIRRHGLCAVIAALLMAVVYWCIGSDAIVAALLIAIAAAAQRQWLTAAAAPLAALAAGAALKTMGCYVTWQEALTPLQYYDWPSTYYFQLYAWASVVVIGIVLNVKKMEAKLHYVAVVVAVASVFGGIMMYKAVHNDRNYMLRQEEQMARQGDWQGIIRLHEGNSDRNCFVSYINLALAKQGQLTERLFEFAPFVVSREEVMGHDDAFQGDAITGASQQARQDSGDEDAQRYSPLLMKNDELSRDGQKVQAVVMYEWGGAALCNARKAAFETNMLTPGCTDPVELQRLVMMSSVFEQPLVAEKYLRRLQRTTMYRSWADSVMANRPQLTARANAIRRTLPKTNTLYMKTQIVKTLQSVTVSSPDNQVAAQFYEAYLLLTMDRQGLREWAAKRHGQHRKLSTLLQQALTIAAPEGTEQSQWLQQCRQMGVADSVISQYKQLLNNEQPQGYENSFWCYYAQHN